MITDLNQIKQCATQQRDEFEVMRYLLERMEAELPDAELDVLVESVAAPVIDAIDCTQCGNCCRSLDVYLLPEDVQRLADGLDVPLDAIETRYVEHEAAEREGEWGKFAAQPCAFLAGNLCTVYAHRPDACRRYPQFTPDFRWTLADTLDGAGLCPIIYNVLVRLLPIVEARSRN